MSATHSTAADLAPLSETASPSLVASRKLVIDNALVDTAPQIAAEPVPTELTGLRGYVQQALLQHPQLLQVEAESRGSDLRVDEARARKLPRLDFSVNGGRTQQSVGTATHSTDFKQRTAELRLLYPLYDASLNAQVSQRRAGSVAADWRVVDVREQLILRTLEVHAELIRATQLTDLARANLKIHRQYAAQVKTIATSDIGRAADLPAASSRVALAESVLTARLAKLEAARAAWQQVIGVSPSFDLADQELPMSRVAVSLDEILERALQNNPQIMIARAEADVAREGLLIASAPNKPRVNAELSQKNGSDWGGVAGKQGNSYAGVSLEWNLFSGFADHYASQSAAEAQNAARHAQDRAESDVRLKVQQAWYEFLSSRESMRSFADYVTGAEQMVEAHRSQFAIGRRTLLEVLNAENELFSARSNMTSARIDRSLASWRLQGMQGLLPGIFGL